MSSQQTDPFIHQLPLAVLLVVLLISALIPSTSYGRTNYAIVIGVSEYLPDMGYSNLKGTRNDALLVYEFLQQRGFEDENIELLAEDSPQSQRPTQRAILDALDRVVGKLKKDDFVYFHFSGHGSQQPSQDPDETDGLDEIILPADTGKWSSETKSVENVITDDVIATYVERVRAKQAFIQCDLEDPLVRYALPRFLTLGRSAISL
jgi:hypothetical protein